jgi:hypothetical protein
MLLGVCAFAHNGETQRHPDANSGVGGHGLFLKSGLFDTTLKIGTCALIDKLMLI